MIWDKNMKKKNLRWWYGFSTLVLGYCCKQVYAFISTYPFMT
jgi:hypothetical protein